jgi:hypothetical protein
MAGVENKYQDTISEHKEGAITSHRTDRRDGSLARPVKSPSHNVAHERARSVTSFGVSKTQVREKASINDSGNVSPELDSREKLYEAYNDLHALAQVFSKDFDAPAILVVGHQTDGKSGTWILSALPRYCSFIALLLTGVPSSCACAALVEALMGFQFNHVGGGTKTRRPIALHMKYNAACMEPNCFLLDDHGNDKDVTLEELQEYIEAENQRLNLSGQFLNQDIVIKIEYKFCPNLTIIDTPGAVARFEPHNVTARDFRADVLLWMLR